MNEVRYVFLPGWGFKPSCFEKIRAGVLSNTHVMNCEYDDNNFSRYCLKLASQIPSQSIIVGWSLGCIVAQSLLNYRPDLYAICISEPNQLTQSDINQLKTRLKRKPGPAFKQFLRWQAGCFKLAKECEQHTYEEPNTDLLDWLLETPKNKQCISIYGAKDPLSGRFCQDKKPFCIRQAGHSLIFSHVEECIEIINFVSSHFFRIQCNKTVNRFSYPWFEKYLSPAPIASSNSLRNRTKFECTDLPPKGRSCRTHLDMIKRSPPCEGHWITKHDRLSLLSQKRGCDKTHQNLAKRSPPWGGDSQTTSTAKFSLAEEGPRIQNQNLQQQQAFNSAAKTYAQSTPYQKVIANNLLQFIGDRIKKTDKVLDLGCGPSRLPIESTGLDFAESTLHKQANAVCADIQSLPFTNHFDWIVSNMALHWCPNLPLAISEIHEALNAKGRLVFSIPVQPSLERLYQIIESEKKGFDFPSEDKIIALCRDKFSLINTQKQKVKLGFKNVRDLCDYFKQSGCAFTQKGLFARKTYEKLNQLIESDEEICFEVLYLECHK